MTDRESPPASISAGVKLPRRAVLAGLGGALLIDSAHSDPASPADPDPLLLSFKDPERQSTLIITYRQQTIAEWPRAFFGPQARFAIGRHSAPFRPVAPKTTPQARANADSSPAWTPAEWRLAITNASFPGGAPHSLLFRFVRTLGFTTGTAGAWMVILDVLGWPSPTSVKQGRIALSAFLPTSLNPPECAAAHPLRIDLAPAEATRALDALFGGRVQTGGGLAIGFRFDPAWSLISEAADLRLLQGAVRGRTLDMTRSVPPEQPKAVDCCAQSVPPAMADPVGDRPPDLEATLTEPRLATAPAGDWWFKAGVAGAARQRTNVWLHAPAQPVWLTARVQHWGEPTHTRATLTLAAQGDFQSVAALRVRSAAGESAFPLTALDIIERRRTDGVLETLTTATPVARDHTVETAFGPVTVAPAPPVPPRPGAAARSPPLRLRATGDGARRLIAFDGVLSLSSLGVRLANAPGDRASSTATRLDFRGAECRFSLAALGAPTGPIAADASIPLGGGAAEAFFDLGLATLRVLRPSDLLALSFRFAGLMLRVPPLAARAATARVLPSRGGPIARGAESTEAGDGRPLLVVDFPPQHVLERAYYRVREPITLPVIKDPKGNAADLQTLRTKSGATDGADPGCLAARRNLSQAAKFDWETNPNKINQFLNNFADKARAAGLPPEQRLYAGPEFLDVDARHLALAVATAPPPDPGKPPIAGFELPDDVLAATLQPFKANPADYKAKPLANLEAAVAVEAAKCRLNADYALFRPAYAAAAKANFPDPVSKIPGPKIDPNLIDYYGWTWFESQQSRPGWATAQKWIETYEANLPNEPVKALTDARLSGPSRLAFRINGDDFAADRAGGGFDFTLAALTNWGGLDLCVVRRAERLFEPPPKGPPPPRWARRETLDDAKLLRFHGISPGDSTAAAADRGLDTDPTKAATGAGIGRVSIAQRMAEVAAGLAAPPTDFETAIEILARLQLSPAQDSTFLTPNHALRALLFPGAGPPAVQEVWSATLAETGALGGVRAIWSPDLRPQALLSGAAPGAPPHGDWAPWAIPRSAGIEGDSSPDASISRFRASLDAYDRHELVVLSSVQGLPVLGRLDSNGAFIDGSQFAPPPGYHLADLEQPCRLVRFPNNKARQPRDLSGIYRPQPLAVSELSLTALGGSLDLDTSFTPPAAPASQDCPFPPPGLYAALSIQRWRHRTVLGRDVVVEVVYKGFLFPIGHRAALIKVTERRFEAAPGGRVVAVLVQHMRIKVAQPVKSFPAYNQPNDARRWPCQTVSVLTRITPDIVDPDGHALALPGLAGRVFWPRTTPGRGPGFRFELRVDGEPATSSLPLLFLDNAAVHDEATVKLVSDYYNKTIEQRYRLLERRGQKIRMAPETKPGDTTLETDWWELRAEGREAAPPEANRLSNTRFALDDPFMEGLDQPSFYPFVQTARCRLGQVERFTGNPAVWSRLAFESTYVAKGFDPAAADSEIFLTIVDDGTGSEEKAPVPMVVAGGDRSGGLAQPNTAVVGLSRRLGPVGDAKLTAAPSNAADALPALAETRQSLDNDNFKPERFFPDGAKLLGLLKLSDVITAAATFADAPVLKEVLEYGADAGGEALDGLKDSVLRPLQEALNALDDAWKTAAANLGQKDETLATAYPDIANAEQNLKTLLDDALNPNTPATDALERLADIYSATRALIGAVDSALRDPYAAISAPLLKRLTDCLAGFAQAANTALQATQGIPKLVTQMLSDLWDQAPWQDVLLVLPTGTDLQKNVYEPALGAILSDTRWPDLGSLPQEIAETAAKKSTPAPDNEPWPWMTVGGRPAFVPRLILTPYVDQLQNALASLQTAYDRWRADPLGAAAQTLQTVASVGQAIWGDLPPVTALEDKACADAPGSAGPYLWQLANALLPLNGSLDASDCAAVAADLARYTDALPSDGASFPDLPSLAQHDPIAPGEACPYLAALVHRAAALEGSVGITATAWRKKMALAGWKLALALAALQRRMATIADWSAPDGSDCTAISATIIHAYSGMFSARDAALEAAQAVLAALAELADLWPVLAIAPADALMALYQAATGTALACFRLRIVATALGTADTGEGDSAKLKLRAEALGKIKAEAPVEIEADPPTKAALDAVAAAGTLRSFFGATAIGTDTISKFHTALAAAVSVSVPDDGALIALANSFLLSNLKFSDPAAVAGQLANLLRPLVESVSGLYDAVLSQLAGVRRNTQNLTDPLLAELVSRLGQVGDKAAQDALQKQSDALHDTITKLKATPPDITGALSSLQTFTKKPDALTAVLQPFQSLGREAVRTIVRSALDLRGFRQELDTLIRGLIPSRARLNYTFDTVINKFPLDAPIFQPLSDDGAALALRSETVIDLLNPGPPKVTVSGTLEPFGIRLFGAFEIVTINFAGLTFGRGSGGDSHFDVRFQSVKMGEQANFLEPIQDYLCPKGDGIYIRPILDRPGIEAGYGLNLGVIGCGALSFSNVILSAGMQLPFGNGGGDDARFTIAIGRADAPFLISSGIFGGGGYLKLVANSSKIIGFEASFNYGGVAAFGFGPLQGLGQITVGFFLRKAGEITTLGGTFFAGGAAHIACFGLSTSLMISLLYDEQGMHGSATYSFSFSFGLGSVSFSVSVTHDAGARMGSKSAQQTSSLGLPYQLASADTVATDALPRPMPRCPQGGPMLRVDGTTMERDHRAYDRYFDTDLRPAGTRTHRSTHAAAVRDRAKSAGRRPLRTRRHSLSP